MTPAQTTSVTPTATVPVTVENFIRAESDLYFTVVAVKEGFFGKLGHHREVMPVDNQTIIRTNRDTLYTSGVFDLDAGPVTVTLPDPGGRFMSLQMISQDEYSPSTQYAPGTYTFTREQAGTRYIVLGVRTLVDPSDPADLAKVHALQDALVVDQKSPGTFELPKGDPVSQKKVRDALIVLGTTLTDTSRAFGLKGEVDPIQRLVSAATTWGGNPRKDAIYLNFAPARNDGKTAYTLTVKDVPVDGFWSISLYNANGYCEQNQYGAYSLQRHGEEERGWVGRDPVWRL